MHPKITPDHLGRGAAVYIRQSHPRQVAEHTESKRRQYALADAARTMGFASITVIDDDLGRSGSGLVERPGFGGFGLLGLDRRHILHRSLAVGSERW